VDETTTTSPDIAALRAVLEQVVDPEIPVLTIDDIGILRGVEFDGSTVVVTITPTYSGCPAMDLIKDEVTAALHGAGYSDVEIRTVYSPAWTTDWMSPEGKRKLNEFGIAPPQPAGGERTSVLCPRCTAATTHIVSEFGSTACKALLVCDACGEPFDYFKEI
jgi:ring-1,2-phenylacetyl-CoA epoxidase subunit PaaD